MNQIKLDCTEKQSTLAGMFKLAQAINDGDIDIEQDGEGWHVKIVDVSRVAMAMIDVRFAMAYECPEPFAFAIDTQKALKILALAKNDVRIVTDGAQMTFYIDGLSRTMQLAAPTGGTVRIPTNIEYKATAKLSDQALRSFLTASDFSETVTMSVNGEGIFELSAASDLDSCRFIVPEADAHSDGGEQRTSYQSEYLRRISRAVGSPMMLDFATNYPVKITISDGLEAQILLAPVVNQD